MRLVLAKGDFTTTPSLNCIASRITESVYYLSADLVSSFSLEYDRRGTYLEISLNALDVTWALGETYSVVVNSGFMLDPTSGFDSLPTTLSVTTPSTLPHVTMANYIGDGYYYIQLFIDRFVSKYHGNVYLYQGATLISTMDINSTLSYIYQVPEASYVVMSLDFNEYLHSVTTYTIRFDSGIVNDTWAFSIAEVNDNSWQVTTGSLIFRFISNMLASSAMSSTVGFLKNAQSNVLSSTALSAPATTVNKTFSCNMVATSTVYAEPVLPLIFDIQVDPNQTITFPAMKWQTGAITISFGDGTNASYTGSDYTTTAFVTSPVTEKYANGITHTYTSPGTYRVTIDGKLTCFGVETNGSPYTSFNMTPCITNIHYFNKDLRVASFKSQSYLSSITNKIPTNLKTIIFTGCASLDDPNISQWDTTNIVSMAEMFDSCTVFNQPLNSWNTSKVETMRNMFKQCRYFNRPLNNWDTSKVAATITTNNLIGESMHSMFSDAVSFNQDISSWDVHLIPSKPAGFDYDTPDDGLFMDPGWTTAKKPQWGTTGSH